MPLALATVLFLQDTVEEILRRDGWRGIDAVVERGDAAKALESLASSKEADLAFLARAAAAELSAAGAPGARALVRTRDVRDKPAREAICALFAEAGLTFMPAHLPDRAITLPDGLPLLEALDRLSRELDVEFYSTDAGVWRVAEGYVRAPRFACRRFRARLDQVRRETRMDFERPPVSLCRLRGRVSADEGARLLGLSNIRVLEALDDAGADLRSAAAGAYQSGLDGHAFTVDLKPPADGVKRLTRLRLSLEAALEKKRETLEFARAPAGARGAGEKKAGAATLRVTALVRERDVWRVDLEATPASALTWAPWDAVRLTDAGGRAFALEAFTTAVNGPRATGTATFRAGEREPAGLSVTLITETFSRPLFIEFTDVPLE